MKKLALALPILLSISLAAQEPAPSPEPSLDLPLQAPADLSSNSAEDYSKERMRFAFRDYLVPPPPTPLDRAPAITVFERWGWVFKYVPIFLGETNDGATFGHAVGHSMPDPFWVLNTGFAETKSTFRPLPPPRDLTLGERRYRRSMIKVTMDSNQADKKP